MNKSELLDEYWNNEAKISAIAHSQGVSIDTIATYSYNYPKKLIDEIRSLMYYKKDLLREIRKIQIMDILNQEVPNLSEYRKLVRR